MNIPKTDENNAGKIVGIRVINTTISGAKKLHKILSDYFPNRSFIEINTRAN